MGYIAFCLKMENTAVHHACCPHSYITIYLFFSFLVESGCSLSQSQQCHHVTKLCEKMNSIKETSSLNVFSEHILSGHILIG